MAGNHMMDCGAQGTADTMDGLDRNHIAHAGAGVDLDAARAPRFIRAGERTIALLSYNCVGPELSWAGKASPAAPISASCLRMAAPRALRPIW
jgi:poly-gamma-glutamate synthesis protein (capsule biosynthesis protein)